MSHEFKLSYQNNAISRRRFIIGSDEDAASHAKVSQSINRHPKFERK